jgi:hypothetical protein
MLAKIGGMPEVAELLGGLHSTVCLRHRENYEKIFRLDRRCSLYQMIRQDWREAMLISFALKMPIDDRFGS